MSEEKTILFQSKGTPEFRFLSNFHLCKIKDVFGVEYHSVEHMYQVWKTCNAEDNEKVLRARTPAEARKLGQTVKLAEGWDRMKDGVMEMCVRLKFFQNEDLAAMLLTTDGFELVEYAPWGDTYWGVDKSLRGQNRLGKILMKVREELKGRKDAPKGP